MTTTTKQETNPQDHRMAGIALPVNQQEWEAEKAERAKERAKKRKVLLECLDAEVAAEYEKKKPTYRYRIQASFRRPTGPRGKYETHSFDETVRAQNDKDAWAMFCDRIGHYPSRPDVDPTIERLGNDT